MDGMDEKCDVMSTGHLMNLICMQIWQKCVGKKMENYSSSFNYRRVKR